jgi:carbonic anhydrase
MGGALAGAGHTGLVWWPAECSDRSKEGDALTLDAILRANRRYARAFGPALLDPEPARSVAVLTCMDVRIDPLAMAGLGLGDAHVVRNAGGRGADALRSLALSCELFGTRRILVVHHTRCGMEGLTNEAMRERLASHAPDGPGIDFLPFADLEDSVRQDVALLRASPLIPPGVAIDGLIYDVATGLLEEVD